MIPSLYISARYERLGDALHDAYERNSLEYQLPRFLQTQRWFGGQSRHIQTVHIDRWVEIESQLRFFCLCVLTAMDSSNVETDHLLVLTTEPVVNGQRAVIDALTIEEARQVLLDLALAGSEVNGYRVTLSLENHHTPATRYSGDSRLISVEQSNSSIVYGDDCILKLYRRLELGDNPDVELTSYLSTRSDFQAIPRLISTGKLESADGYRTDALMLQSFVPNYGDGWQWAVSAAQTALTSVDNAQGLSEWLANDGASLQGARTLGEITASLHAALSQADLDGLQPERATDEDLAQWVEELKADAAESANLLQHANLPDRAEILDSINRLASIAEPEIHDLGMKIRVHGDYHLGQVLKTEDGFVVVDFEGEPARSLVERRALRHPLTDVAGMLRSWSYAGTAALREVSKMESSTDERESIAHGWSHEMRRQFLDAYWTRATETNSNLLPTNQEDSQLLLSLFELRKALYEVRYELNYRPAWVSIPATAILMLTEALTN